VIIALYKSTFTIPNHTIYYRPSTDCCSETFCKFPSASKQHLGRFIRFCRAHGRNQHIKTIWNVKSQDTSRNSATFCHLTAVCNVICFQVLDRLTCLTWSSHIHSNLQTCSSCHKKQNSPRGICLFYATHKDVIAAEIIIHKQKPK